MESRTWPVNIFDMQIFALFVERAMQTQTYRDRRKLQVVETKRVFIIILCNSMHIQICYHGLSPIKPFE